MADIQVTLREQQFCVMGRMPSRPGIDMFDRDVGA